MNSNRGPLGSKATTLLTEPQPLANYKLTDLPKTLDKFLHIVILTKYPTSVNYKYRLAS